MAAEGSAASPTTYISTFYETFQTPISQLKSKWGVLTYFKDSKPKIGIFGQFETNSIRVFQK